MAIRSFKDERARMIFEGRNPGKGSGADLVRRVLRKLEALNGASCVGDLRTPPGNRLEALKGDLEGLWSVCVNDQFRVVFAWKNDDAYDVQIVDYH